jgi:hypothetical protein
MPSPDEAVVIAEATEDLDINTDPQPTNQPTNQSRDNRHNQDP